VLLLVEAVHRAIAEAAHHRGHGRPRGRPDRDADIERDGVLKGLNLPATAALARATRIPVIASGGLASIADVRDLKKPEYSRLEGAITGRALYDGRLNAKEALELLETS